MKKSLFVIMLIAALTASVYAADVKLISTSGTVEIKEPGGEWTPAEAGQSISLKSIISTGFGSRARIDAGGMIMNLQPLTRISVENLTEKENTTSTQVSLKSGRVRATRPPATRAERRSIDFRVSTPVATAAVRGTDFEIGANNRLVTYEGLVELSRGETRVYSSGGTSAWAEEIKKPMSPAPPTKTIASVSSAAGSVLAEEEDEAPIEISPLGSIIIEIE